MFVTCRFFKNSMFFGNSLICTALEYAHWKAIEFFFPTIPHSLTEHKPHSLNGFALVVFVVAWWFAHGFGVCLVVFYVCSVLCSCFWCLLGDFYGCLLGAVLMVCD